MRTKKIVRDSIDQGKMMRPSKELGALAMRTLDGAKVSWAARSSAAPAVVPSQALQNENSIPCIMPCVPTITKAMSYLQLGAVESYCYEGLGQLEQKRMKMIDEVSKIADMADSGYEEQLARSSLLLEAIRAPPLPMIQKYPEDGYLILINAFTRLIGDGIAFSSLPASSMINDSCISSSRNNKAKFQFDEIKLKYNFPFVSFDTFHMPAISKLLAHRDITSGQAQKAFFDVISRYFKVDFDFYTTNYREHATLIAFNLFRQKTTSIRVRGAINVPNLDHEIAKETFTVLEVLFEIVTGVTVEEWTRFALKKDWTDVKFQNENVLDGRFPWDDSSDEERALKQARLRKKEEASYKMVQLPEFVDADEGWEMVTY